MVQYKRIIEIHPCRGTFVDSLTVVQHFRKRVPSRSHEVCFNTGRSITIKFMLRHECCYKIQPYKHTKLVYIYIYIYIQTFYCENNKNVTSFTDNVPVERSLQYSVTAAVQPKPESFYFLSGVGHFYAVFPHILERVRLYIFPQ